jgi:hypothetical protein
MIGSLRSTAGRALRGLVVFKSQEFRINVLDLLRRTPALRGDSSSLAAYLDWRHQQIQRLGLGFYREFPDFKAFLDSYHSKVDRIALVVSYLQASFRVPGDVAEFGVFRGHTAVALGRELRQRNSTKRLFLFDSFAGMPVVTHPLDQDWKAGDLSYPVERVRALFEGSNEVTLVEGFFSDTFPLHPDLRFSFCHVDSDLYSSVTECIDYILPRLTPGGVIVFDDYGGRATPGAKAAVEERLGGEPPRFVPLPTGQAVYVHLSHGEES